VSQSGTDISPRLAAVEGRLSEFTTGLAEVTARLSGIGNVVGSLPEEVRALSERVESRLGNRLDRLDEIAASVATLQSAPGANAGFNQELAEIRGALQGLTERPSLVEDRESVVLAIQQVLGEMVRTTVTELSAHSEQRVLDAVRSMVSESSGQSEQRILDGVRSTLSESSGRSEQSEQRILDGVRSTLSESSGRSEQSEQRILDGVRSMVSESSGRSEQSEQRILEHVDGAVITLAEALLKRRSASARATAESLGTTQAPVSSFANPVSPFSPAPGSQADEPDETPPGPPPSAAREAMAGLAEDAPIEPAGDPAEPSSQPAYFSPAELPDDGEDADDGAPEPAGLTGEVVSEHQGPQEPEDSSEDVGRRRRAWWRPGE
jgi:predicted RNA binding protein with dsRBD fold (UPF0201 family)